MKKIYKICSLIFIIFFMIIFLGGIFLNLSQIMRIKLYYLLPGTIGMILFLLLIYIIYEKSLKRLTLKKEKIIVGIISIILFLTLLILGINLKSTGNFNQPWDLRIVIGYVNSFVSGSNFQTLRELEYINYVNLYSNSSGLICILIPWYKLFRIFGVTSKLLPGIILNIIFIFISLLSVYFIIRKIYGNKIAVFVFGMSIFISPVFLYSAIVYTDTMSIPFILLQVILYIYFKDSKKFYLIVVLISILAFLGFIIKPTSLFITIAILIDIILKNKNKKIINIIVLIITFLIGLIIYNNIIFPNVFKYYDSSKKIPYEHFIMMGLREKNKYNWEEGEHGYKVYGVFDYEDVLYTNFETRNQKKLEKQKYYEKKYYTMLMSSPLTRENKKILARKELINRINNFTNIEFFKFLTKKAIQTWADGSCYVSVKLARTKAKNNVLLSNLFKADGTYFVAYYYFSHFVHLSIIFYMILGTIYELKNNNYIKTAFIRNSILMLILLLLFWETRSRYIVNYLLLLYSLSSPGFICLYKKYNKTKLKEFI